MKIEIVEPPDDYIALEEKGCILITCDCSAVHHCQQGHVGAQTKCFVWVNTNRFRRSVLKELRKPITR